MVTPIDAVRFHSTFGEAEFWLRAQSQPGSYDSPQQDKEEQLGPARGAALGIILGGVLWVGLIAGFRAMTGL